MKESKKFKLKIEFGSLKFEAEGPDELVIKEREVFLNNILPAVANIMQNSQTTTVVNMGDEYALQRNVPLSSNTNTDSSVTDEAPGPANHDLNRTSLAGFAKKHGKISEADFVLIAAFYCEEKNGGTCIFTTKTVAAWQQEARRGQYSNNSILVGRLVKKGFVMENGADEEKMKTYSLTNDGIEYIKSKKDLYTSEMSRV